MASKKNTKISQINIKNKIKNETQYFKKKKRKFKG
jgi:hypothetical protein